MCVFKDVAGDKTCRSGQSRGAGGRQRSPYRPAQAELFCDNKHPRTPGGSVP